MWKLVSRPFLSNDSKNKKQNFSCNSRSLGWKQKRDKKYHLIEHRWAI